MPRTAAPPRPTYPPAPAPIADDQQRLNLSITQVLASGLAALTATVVMSFLGVAGTVIGAVVGSVCSVVGTAVYGHSLRRTRDRLPFRRTSVTPGGYVGARAAAGWAQPTYHSAGRTRLARPAGRRSRAARLALGTGVVFLALLACVTSVEAVAHRPLADLLRNQSGSGTSFFGGSHRTASSTAPATAHRTRAAAGSRHSSAPTNGTTPAAPTVTRTVTETPRPTHSPTPTGSATPPPSPSPTSTGAQLETAGPATSRG